MASGAWESIVINGRRFTCKADDTVNYNLPGFQNEVNPNSDGTNRMKKTKVAGKISGINVICDDGRDDLEFLQESQDSLDFFTISGTKVDGTVYSGNMQITEVVELDSSENTAAITLVGNLEKLG